MHKKLIIGVIGAGHTVSGRLEEAYRVGELIAQRGAVMICGGLGGGRIAATRGCAEAGGEVIGVLPGDSSTTANPYVTIPIVTDFGHARNIIIAQTAHALIAIEGEYGTLSEIAIGMKLGKPVIDLGGWAKIPTTFQVDTPEHAIQVAFDSITEGRF